MSKLLFALSILFLLVGCAPPPSNMVELNPQPTINATPVGNGKAIVLQVIDARSQTLDSEYTNANIDPQQNVSQIFSDQVSKALAAYGFTTATIPNTQQNQFTLKILSIEYLNAQSYLGANTQTNVSAEVDAISPKGTYKKTYYASSYSDNYLSSNKQDASQLMNSAVNKLLNNILNDQALMQFLAN